MWRRIPTHALRVPYPAAFDSDHHLIRATLYDGQRVLDTSEAPSGVGPRVTAQGPRWSSTKSFSRNGKRSL